MGYNIAIDGPAGAGKSTIAKRVAKELGYVYVDTGAMYRAITLKALNEGAELSSNEKIGALLESTDIDLQPSDSGQLVFLDGNNVTEAIRSQAVTGAVSEVSAHESVRMQMAELQQRLAEGRGVVMDGRDIGTHVLPAAQLKVLLDKMGLEDTESYATSMQNVANVYRAFGFWKEAYNSIT